MTDVFYQFAVGDQCHYAQRIVAYPLKYYSGLNFLRGAALTGVPRTGVIEGRDLTLREKHHSDA